MSNSRANALSNIRQYIVELMELEGRISKHTICELCLTLIPGNRYDIHHTKYKEATYYDLLVVCRRCNTQQEQRYLD